MADAAISEKNTVTDELHEELQSLRLIWDNNLNNFDRFKDESDALRWKLHQQKCLSKISEKIHDNSLGLTQTLEAMVEIIPVGWDCNECFARILLNDLNISSKNHFITSMGKKSKIYHNKKPIGYVEIGYNDSKPNHIFLDESFELLDNIAKKIGWYYEMHLSTQKLKDSELFHRIILSSISDTVVIVDKNGEFVYICPNIAKIFEYKPEEIREIKNINRLMDLSDFDLAKIKLDEEYENLEKTVKDKNGDLHSLLVNLKGVSIGGGNVLITCRDITARRNKEKDLEEKKIAMKQILEHIEEEKRDFKKDISTSLEQSILPSLNNIIQTAPLHLTKELKTIYENLQHITSETSSINSIYSKLTPREIEICQRIKEGATSKDIANYLAISHKTVHKHRQIIRKKLKLTNRKINLTAFLRNYE